MAKVNHTKHVGLQFRTGIVLMDPFQEETKTGKQIVKTLIQDLGGLSMKASFWGDEGLRALPYLQVGTEVEILGDVSVYEGHEQISVRAASVVVAGPEGDNPVLSKMVFGDRRLWHAFKLREAAIRIAAMRAAEDEEEEAPTKKLFTSIEDLPVD